MPRWMNNDPAPPRGGTDWKLAGVGAESFVQPFRTMNPSPDPKTRAEPGHAAFPITLWTVVLQARSEDPARAADALHRLCVQYERAIHAWFQRSRPAWIPAGRAEEWAQDFFVFMHEKNPFRRVEQRDSRFRSFLVTCLKNFLKDKLDVELAAKRGAGAEHVSLDETSIAAASDNLAEILDRELANAIHVRVMARIQEAWTRKGQAARYDALRPHILGVQPNTSYDALAAPLGLTANHVKKVVFDLRESYYDFFRDEVGQIVTDAATLDDEMRYLAGLLAAGAGGAL